MRKWVAATALLLGLVLLGAGGCDTLVRWAEDLGNPVATSPPYAVGRTAQALHDRLWLADLHADTLLSARDPRLPAAYGHLDLPRLRAGRVRLQVFAIATNMPLCPGLRHCARTPNLVALLAAVQGWPSETWSSDKARALHQAARMRAIAADPAARIILLRERSDLSRLADEWHATASVGILLGVEGAQAIGEDLAGVDELADAGVRLLGLAHFFDNAVSGSAQGIAGTGLSPFGRQVLSRAQERGMIIDLAHAPPPAVADVLAHRPVPPVLLSHTGLRSVCDHPRNLDDARLQAIVAAGGLIGIGAWDQILCLAADAPATAYADAMARSIVAAVAIADRQHPGRGHEYIALGSDFDGWVRVGFDASGWVLLTEALLRHGPPRLGPAEIAAIMGGNVCRFIHRALPGGPGPASTDPCE